MTVPVQTPVSSSTANGLTTVFPYNFKIAAAEDLAVALDGVKQTSGYSVSGVGSDSGGNVTFAVAPANGVKVVIYLSPVLKRTEDYQQFGDWIASIVNLDFDRIWLALQSLSQTLVRTIKLPVDTTTEQSITQSAAARANKGIKFDGFGNLILSTYDPDDAQTAGASAAAAAAAAAASQSAAANSEENAAASAAAAAASPVAAPTHSATSKTTPVDADEIPLIDSAASWVLKKLTWANIKSTLKTYFDTLYAAASSVIAQASTTEISNESAVTKYISPDRLSSSKRAVKAWCTFAGATAGTNAPTNGFNVTSVTKNATGNWTVNFTTAMANANFSYAISYVGSAGIGQTCGKVSSTTSSITVFGATNGVGAADLTEISVTIFG